MPGEAGDWKVAGRTALVSGAGRNVGREIALALAGIGMNVAVNVRNNIDEAREVCAAIEARGVGAVPVPADVSSPAAVDAMFVAVHAALGPVSVLVNNAAIRPHQAFLDITPEDWDEVIGVGLRGPFLCARIACRDMRAGSGGRIVNISGRDGFVGRTHRAHGVTAKAGLHGFTKALASELGPWGITANTVVPGVVATTRRPDWYPDRDYATRAETIPVRRLGRPRDVAEVCAFLAADQGYVSGTAIHVNGGESLV